MAPGIAAARAADCLRRCLSEAEAVAEMVRAGMDQNAAESVVGRAYAVAAPRADDQDRGAPAPPPRGQGKPTTSTSKVLFKPWSEIRAELDRPMQWLVQGLLAPGELAVLFGKWGSGKTFATLDLALSLATSAETWAGRRLRCNGPILYLAAEDPQGVARRVRAWEIRRSKQVPDTFRLAGCAVRFDVEGAAAVQAEMEAMDPKPAMVVIDTLARAGAFEENDNAAASAFVARLDTIRAATGCTFLLVGHPGHEGTRLRGASGIPAAADVVIKAEIGAGKKITLEAGASESTKLKNSGQPFTAVFQLESVELGSVDCFGSPTTAGCVRHLPNEHLEAAPKHPPAKAWTLFVQAWTAAGKPTVDGLPALQRPDITQELLAGGASKEAAKKSTDRAVKALKEAGTLTVYPTLHLVVTDRTRAAMLVGTGAGTEGTNEGHCP